MGASGDKGRHIKPEESKTEDQAEKNTAEETTAESQIKYPGGPAAGTSGTTSGAGGEEEQIKYPG